MAQLADCPDELLLNIAVDIGSRDLKALALTARKYRGTAQEALHTHVNIYSAHDKLPKILMTLTERPDLASKIRSIETDSPNYGYQCSVSPLSWKKVITRAY
jgi:hypothetical protein